MATQLEIDEARRREGRRRVLLHPIEAWRARSAIRRYAVHRYGRAALRGCALLLFKTHAELDPGPHRSHLAIGAYKDDWGRWQAHSLA